MLNEERDEFLGIQDTLKALADPIRREILNLLKNGRLSAGEICEHFSVTGASISRHLAILKEADLIRNQREGKFIYYELNTQHTDLKHQQAIEKFVQPFILDPFMLSVQNINQGIQFISEDQLDMFYRSALLYKQSQWHFWLLRWFRVKKSTPMVNIDLQ